MTDHLTGIQQRTFTITSTRDDQLEEKREFTAIGVPWNTIYDTGWDYRERFDADSVDADGAILVYRHADPIGLITSTRSTDDGLEITARISKTPRGDEVYTLIRDGVLHSMSIGFTPIAYRHDEVNGQDVTTITQAKAHEFSVVPNPAYESAQITQVRQKKEPEMTQTTTNEIDDLRSHIDDLDRKITALPTHHEPPAPDTRSAGAIVKAIADGDDQTIKMVNGYMSRAFDGTKIEADGASATPVWIKDLTRIIDNANPLAHLFSTAALPAEGMSIEYTQLKSNTISVAQQKNEGDQLALGTVATETKNAPIYTYGGATKLSFQAIQRARTNMVDLSLRAMAVAAAKQNATAFHSFLEKQISEQAKNAISITKAASALTWPDLLAMLLDVNKAYNDLGLALDGAIVDRATFLAIGSLEGKDGRPLMDVTGTGSNTVGTIDAKAFQGQLGNVTFVPDYDATSARGTSIAGTFYNAEALRTYTSGIAHLQDENVLTLTRDMSVYYYAAHAAEIPAALVPLKLGAA